MTSGPLTYAQLEGLWIRAGGPVAQAPTAAAIAQAESGGQAGDTNPSDNHGTQTSWGLWQISNGTHSAPSPQWNVPIVNARLAVAKYKGAGNSFSPWGTFNSGAYRKFMSNGTTPDFSAAGGGGKFGPGVSAQIGGPPPNPDPGCLVPFSLPQISVPLAGSVGGGQLCLMRKSQARAWIGAGLMGAGGFVLFGSFAILVGTGLARTKAVAQAGQAAGFVAAPLRGARSAGARARPRRKAAPAAAPAAATQPAAAPPASRSGTAPPPARRAPSRPPVAPGMGPGKSGTAPPRPRARKAGP